MEGEKGGSSLLVVGCGADTEMRGGRGEKKKKEKGGGGGGRKEKSNSPHDSATLLLPPPSYPPFSVFVFLHCESYCASDGGPPSETVGGV